MIKSISKIFLLSVILLLLMANTVIAQNKEKIEWQAIEEMTNYSSEDISKIIEGTWVFKYRICQLSGSDSSKNEENGIEFKKGNIAFLWNKNIRSKDTLVWKINIDTKGWFSLDLQNKKTAEYISPHNEFDGTFTISKDLNFISFSNDIEIDAGCLVCYKRFVE
jgi:hypothetical protein